MRSDTARAHGTALTNERMAYIRLRWRM